MVRGGLRRRRPSRWASLLLALLAVAVLFLGLGYATGAVRSVAGIEGLWLHIALALGLVPLLLWHVVVRKARPRRTDLSRRVMLRAGLLGATAAALYVATEATTTVLDLPGTRRRFTGSYELGSFNPAAMPNTIWLDDTTPPVDPAQWRLTIVDTRGSYELSLSDLQRYDDRRRATLDCTSGWYAHQEWTGAPVASLLRGVDGGRSLFVHSVTGYWVRLPIADVDQLLLATAVGGMTLSGGHGWPLRLVAPARRGFWWVKWVDRIEVQTTPWWWQSPFPLT